MAGQDQYKTGAFSDTVTRRTYNPDGGHYHPALERVIRSLAIGLAAVGGGGSVMAVIHLIAVAEAPL